MRFNLDNLIGRDAASRKLSEMKGIIELSNVSQTRSSRQNRALHLFFTIICQQLNNQGIDFECETITGNRISIPYTPEFYKNEVWRKIQIALFDIYSTTKINTQQINMILDVLTVHYSKMGIPVNFPNQFDKYLQFEANK